ncbi:glycosyltransferase family 4 protein [Lacrimispora saccharolytica]|uniref:glycosyltransferase family 4 protein n=1 Tax=Lacrimispora saccharolytica TaxID=84030 RepID=UPI00265CA9F8|nr:glycosyltransferase family 4 protein [Lacrimispora saccharolytica]MCF2657219.1 glycosyltransferase family 4 protein [Lacrimispora saccharolytica]
MRITMVSNYISHHQLPFSDAMFELCEEYSFVQTMPMEQKRIDMGWAVDPTTIPYVIENYKEPDKARRAIDEADLLIVGWIEDETIVSGGLRSGKPVFRISERIYREGQWRFISPKGLARKYREHISLKKYPVYLLCNGAYVASDYKLIGAYPHRKYRFGYFPPFRKVENVSELQGKKAKLHTLNIEHPEELPIQGLVLTKEEINIVWAGRFIELKNPGFMIRLADDLNRRGIRFHIHMIGSGELEEELKAEAEYRLIDHYITFHGMLSPEATRDVMEKCHIHIFTSNYLEGWGAVVNEAMNAGCAVIANEEVGCAPYLIRNGSNGLTYQASYEDMLDKVMLLVNYPGKIADLGINAYRTIADEWNGEVAAKRVIEAYEKIISACNRDDLADKNRLVRVQDFGFASGPLSVAPVIKPGFFKGSKFVN